MPERPHLPDHVIRAMFASEMSRMYQEEVPLYGRLLSIVKNVNDQVLSSDCALAEQLGRQGELNRFNREYHGAIRLGKPAELATVRRLFAVMGMSPFGYYDLSVAGIPVHSTAFRPVDTESLRLNPFRIFTSLLRPELIEDRDVRAEVVDILKDRTIFSDATIALIERFERDGGLNEGTAGDFVAGAIETFRWHKEAPVAPSVYRRLHEAHRLVADIACFRGPHINHLTPRTLDIDVAQRAMSAGGIDAKEIVEGPPRRDVPILLRQTSFKALNEAVFFADGGLRVSGTHTARFGEIEQRGLALTPKGQALYDTLLDTVRTAEDVAGLSYEERLEVIFRKFPDDARTIRREGLGYFQYQIVGKANAEDAANFDLESLIEAGVVEADPITYEDFLPVSAAGIFQSNLGDGGPRERPSSAAKTEFEEALGARVIDIFDWYAEVERRSIATVEKTLSGVAIGMNLK